ncbi:serine/threonine-protein kinase [Nocardia sp. NBC_01329]|uniref:serine/threonine-protein kinase n=1 Tax=Nocardia sp. NBC_01329 TaxID=2903594 RepID=UPI002E154C0C|nr:serine/threonine protein kinase [Nocardia sp. NBC_01329]
MLTNGALIADRYRLQRLIATGGMGQVWEALDTRLDRRVAVKVLKSEFSADPTFRHRFRTEAKTTAILNHSGIAGIYDYGETYDPQGGETAYLVMELVQGEPLNTVLNRLGRLSVAQGLDMLEQTARALQVAHLAGVVHRDVKPGNILVTPTGQVKITDFGIAKAVDASPVTKTGMVMGTAQYIAPEQAVGEDATAASDVYSLGVVGYEALAGQRPFTGDGALTVAMKHVRDVPPPMPTDLPSNVRELIEITLAKDPSQRYADGGEFAEAVATVRSGRRPPPPRNLAAAGPTGVIAAPLPGYDETATVRYNTPPAAMTGPATAMDRGAHDPGDGGYHDGTGGILNKNQKWMIALGVGALLLGGAVLWLLFGGDTDPAGTPPGTSSTAPTTRPLPPPVTTTYEVTEPPVWTPTPENTTTPPPATTTTTPPPATTTTTQPPTTTSAAPSTTETTASEQTSDEEEETTTRRRPPVVIPDVPFPTVGNQTHLIEPADNPQGQP